MNFSIHVPKESKKMKSIGLILAAALCISGCASNLTYDYYGNNPEYKTDPRKIVISEGDIKDKKY